MPKVTINDRRFEVLTASIGEFFLSDYTASCPQRIVIFGVYAVV
jgi:hypothetical protein